MCIRDREGWLDDLAEELLSAGLFIGQPVVVTNLQGVVRRAFGWPDAANVERGVASARRRICKVDVIAGSVTSGENITASSGTGFLIGPSVVLTSFHVVKDLVNEQLPNTGGRTPKDGSASMLIVTFDFATDQHEPEIYKVAADNWLIGSSLPHPAELGSVDTAEVIDLSGNLDYAAILIAGSPGSERGHYDIQNLVEPTFKAQAHLMQHPLQLKQRFTTGELTGFRPDSGEERLLHTANSGSGSSGGLLLDGNYQLVGLHQGEIPGPGRLVESNTAISAIAIARDFARQNIDPLRSDYVYQHRIADKSRPIVGRQNCQDWARSGDPLVRVFNRGGRRGHSFSEFIMRACLPTSDHFIVKITVPEFPTRVLETADLLLERLAVPNPGFTTEEEASTSRGAWITVVVAEFLSAVNIHHTERTPWVLIDDFREGIVPEAGCAEFLSELYRQVAVSYTHLTLPTTPYV